MSRFVDNELSHVSDHKFQPQRLAKMKIPIDRGMNPKTFTRSRPIKAWNHVPYDAMIKMPSLTLLTPIALV